MSSSVSSTALMPTKSTLSPITPFVPIETPLPLLPSPRQQLQAQANYARTIGNNALVIANQAKDNAQGLIKQPPPWLQQFRDKLEQNFSTTLVPYYKKYNDRLPLLGLTVGSLFLSALLIGDSLQASRLKNQQLFNAKDNLYLQKDFFYRSAKYSGYPTLDNLAERYHRLTLYGPWGLGVRWENFKTNVSTFFTDVLLPNSVPLVVGGVALGQLVGARNMLLPFRALNALRKTIVTPLIENIVKPLFQPVLVKPLKSLTVGVLEFPFKKLSNFAVTLGLLTSGIFFLDRFRDVYDGTAQKNFFYDITAIQGPYRDLVDY
ncbi:MAG: hypothetical protein AAGI66_02760 [Cyanobacteria bacterium P01_H01_bin.74]